jgi:cell shape-determining protein MreD
MGIIWDALQGGIIEVATFKIPFIVFIVDSGYHVFVEGSVAGLVLYYVSKKWSVRNP